MLTKKAFFDAFTKTVEKLRDTKYITCDVNERLSLARLEVSVLRSELMEAHDAKTAELCQKKLRAAQEEYSRVLRISRSKSAG